MLEMNKNILKSKWLSIAVNRKEINLKKVLTSGQSFSDITYISPNACLISGRWKTRVIENNEELIGVFSGVLWILRQDNEKINFKVIEAGGNATLNYSDDVKYKSILHKYLQLDVKLTNLYAQWKSQDDSFQKLTENETLDGIRILYQDPVECLFSFICSSNNNISRISRMVESMCTLYGDKICDLDGISYHRFPEVASLMGEDVRETLKLENFGYRAGFVSKSAEAIYENGGRKWLEELKTVGYEKACLSLQSLPGIGRKIADCVCLMSLGYPEAIPVDTHIHKVGKDRLPHLAHLKSLTERVYSEISDHFRTTYGEYAGWAQAVLFCSELRVPSVPKKKKRKIER